MQVTNKQKERFSDMEYLIMVGLGLVAVLGWAKFSKAERERALAADRYVDRMDDLLQQNRDLTRHNCALKKRYGVTVDLGEPLNCSRTE